MYFRIDVCVFELSGRHRALKGIVFFSATYLVAVNGELTRVTHSKKPKTKPCLLPRRTIGGTLLLPRGYPVFGV